MQSAQDRIDVADQVIDILAARLANVSEREAGSPLALQTSTGPPAA
jgi:hypothetical protein